jgi:hypothetical protein
LGGKGYFARWQTESWRVVIMRSRGEYLGSVEAPDRERAKGVAIKQFDFGPGPAQPAPDPCQKEQCGRF